MTYTFTPGRIALPIKNSPDKIQLNRLAHVYYSHPDLDKWHQFALDFGFVEASRSADNNTIYYRGYGKDQCVYVATKSTDGVNRFGGAAFIAQTEQDFIRCTKLESASPVSPYKGPGGGRIVTMRSPSEIEFHVIWGNKDLPTPLVTVSASIVHKGDANTPLQKPRKGEFQRFNMAPAMVHKLGHFGCMTTLFDEDVAFFTQTFNFVPSDVLYEEEDGKDVDTLTFLHLDHQKEYTDHHTLFLFQAPPDLPAGLKHKVHHCSFEVEDFDTQFLGHEFLLSKNYSPVWGVGRHILGSQIFDYWKDPSGFTIEHYADGDVVNEDVPTGRDRSVGAASMYVWGPVRPAKGLA